MKVPAQARSAAAGKPSAAAVKTVKAKSASAPAKANTEEGALRDMYLMTHTLYDMCRIYFRF